MTGRSVVLDPLTHAVRADLADIRLADRVFAPHYAAARLATATRAVSLRGASAGDAAIVGQLEIGDSFEALEFAGANAWGIAPRLGLVGYVDADALTLRT
ncbi:MAG: SH3 domain-containing protein [Pseudomonadota bacterium]|nr:SH3 domain-containing protein [Pseudomonadota bacterium]